MIYIFGHRFVSVNGTSPDEFDETGKPTGELTVAGDTWMRGLRGVSERQIATGLAACVNGELRWPELAEFKALCLGVPSLAMAKLQIRTKQKTPFIRQLWRYLDSFRFYRASTETADRMLEDAYELTRAHVMVGGELPPEPVAEITHQSEQGTPASEETAKANIEAILEALNR